MVALPSHVVVQFGTCVLWCHTDHASRTDLLLGGHVRSGDARLAPLAAGLRALCHCNDHVQTHIWPAMCHVSLLCGNRRCKAGLGCVIRHAAKQHPDVLQTLLHSAHIRLVPCFCKLSYAVQNYFESRILGCYTDVRSSNVHNCIWISNGYCVISHRIFLPPLFEKARRL